jgi:hypothetical protein
MIYAHSFLPNNLKYNRADIIFFVYQIFSFLLIKEKKLKINLYSNLEHINKCKNLGLNYDNFIEINHDDKYRNYWSSSKMKTFEKMNDEIIIDHDVFLFKDLSNLLDQNDLIYTHDEIIEERKWYCGELLKIFAQSVPKNLILEWDYLVDSFYDKNLNLKNENEAYSFKAYNCSIIGFKNSKYAKDYAEKSLLLFEFFNKFYKNISYLYNSIYLPTIPEQLFLSFYAKYHNLKTYSIYETEKEKDSKIMTFAHLSSKEHRDKYLDKILNVINIKYPNIYKNLIKLTV